MEINSDILTAALAKAVADSVSTELQQEIFAKALHLHLFVENQRDGGRSVIKDAFTKALNQVTEQLAVDVVAEPENRARIEAAFRAALDLALKDGALVERIANKMTGSLRY